MSSGSHSERFLTLGQHLGRAAKITEIIDVLRAKKQLQGREHVRRRQPNLFNLHAVYVSVERGRAGVEECEDPRESRVFIGGRNQRFRRISQRLRSAIVAVFYHQLEAAGRTQTLDGRRIDGENKSIFDDGQALTHRR